MDMVHMSIRQGVRNSFRLHDARALPSPRGAAAMRSGGEQLRRTLKSFYICAHPVPREPSVHLQLDASLYFQLL